MSAPAQLPTPTDHLIREVAFPAFFEKLASVAGISPPDAASAQRLVDIGDVVTPAVGLFVEKQARAGATGVASAIKEAADAMFGLLDVPQQPLSSPGMYLDIPGVRDAALVLADQAQKQAKQAMEGCAPGANPNLAPPFKKKDEDEEEEGTEPKKMPGAV